MLNKELIKKNFQKSTTTYNDNAQIQIKMAQELIKLIPDLNYDKILEIGSYTGILTQLICQKIEFKSYLALDIIDSKKFIDKINKNISFIQEDIEDFQTYQKFDLIVANASLQWCDDFYSVIKKLKSYLNKNGVLAFSIFSNNNLSEIKDIFKISLNYPEIDKIKEILPKALIKEKKETITFKTSKELLKHFSSTGVNSINKNALTYSEIKANLKIFEEKYKNNLTYLPLYIVFKNN